MRNRYFGKGIIVIKVIAKLKLVTKLKKIEFFFIIISNLIPRL